MAEIHKKPLEHPAPGCTPAPHPPLTPDQQNKYNSVLSAVRSWESIPKTSAKGAETAPLSDSEKLWLTRECLLRYLRATKWHVQHAIKRLQDTLVWRREYGTEDFTADYISEENATGKQVLFGYDNEGRPCLYLLPNKQNTKNSPKQVQHLVYMLERTLDIAPPGQETLALLIDFRNSSAGSQPSVGTGRAVLHILQNHYPERLGRALITHLPWYVTAFLKVISPFIDPVTKTKIRYNEPLTDHVPASQLMKNAGGECEFEYDHSVYWPAFNALAETRRKERVDRWEKAGKIIGESEIYLWGGEEPSVVAQEQGEKVEEVAKGLEKLDVNASEEEKTSEPATSDGAAKQEEQPVTQADEKKPDVTEETEQIKVAA
ncbi:CRAL/TRIO domain-containing protein [Westerdykella ornata]|uniref:CRAL/TRIO domain-containing protein n=1 Tax=Westerdykella ornata TaxID=318751 RepID=A0A6A6J9X1_WESOR|nr:CRAL/TRIO domain-containing protein [Westerdykella ornata]KAF2273135.1 CRAL/TRIO domain-containing protein [Westerdykella ornata]